MIMFGMNERHEKFYFLSIICFLYLGSEILKSDGAVTLLALILNRMLVLHVFIRIEE